MGTNGFMMKIEKIDFNINKGFMAEGKISQGKVFLGDSLEIIGNSKLNTFIALIERIITKDNNKKYIMTGSAKSGEKVRLLLTSSSKDPISVGQFISTPQLFEPHSKFKSKISLFNENQEKLETFTHNVLEVQIKFTSNLETNATLHLLDNFAKVELNIPLAIKTDFAFHIYQENKKIGTGIITEIIE